MTRRISAFQIKQLARFDITADPKMSYDKAYALLSEQFAKAKTAPKAKAKQATPKPVEVEQPVNGVYNIQVCTSIKRDTWANRTTVTAKSANHALRQYGIRGTRPRLGEATSKSGKRFRAVAA